MIATHSHFDWCKPFVAFLAAMLLFLSLFRIFLVIWLSERITIDGGISYIIFQGMRFDLVLFGLLLAIPATLMPILATFNWTLNISVVLLKAYLLILTTCLVFMELATPDFILQFDFRPNFLFVEYLGRPKEVVNMLLKAMPAQLFVVFLMTGTAVYGMYRLLSARALEVKPSFISTAPLLALFCLLVCVLAARSTIGHRPVNPSTVAFSSDPLINTLPLNSTYTVLYAMYEKFKHENVDSSPYGTMAYSEVLNELISSAGLSSKQFKDSGIPTLHHQSIGEHSPFSSDNNSERTKNLVIILEESLGANHVGKLGGLPITPQLDSLAAEGLWFNRLYATGTRSVRGIEAIVTGFLPTPMRSVVKLGGSQYGFFTIADLLSKHGYDTSFIYGGEAHFDNMKRFFTNNGFSQIVEEKDYDSPTFSGSWGVSDEDLFAKAHTLFTAKSKQKKPFFSLIFTSSNHSPFEFPSNRIDLYEQPKATVANAVKYADFALGAYIEQAKQSTYWQDTVFLIIADHSDRVHGAELVPVDKFRIPGLILNAGTSPKEIDRVCSQIDMLPTLLSLIGIESNHPAIGIDLNRSDLKNIPGRAIMQYNDTFAYMEENEVVILRKNQAPKDFLYEQGKLAPTLFDDTSLRRRAIAHAIWPITTYFHKNYRLPTIDTNNSDTNHLTLTRSVHVDDDKKSKEI